MVTTDPQLTCDLADIRFTFTNLTSGDFNSFFTPFFVPCLTVREHCLVELIGPNEALCALRSTEAWNFQQRQGVATLSGANPAGEVMWRMTGRVPFEHLCFEWHPTAFDAMYRNEVYGSYGIVVILALVLRLLHSNGLVIHGSAQVVDGEAIICTGPSGRGKSTLSRLFASCGIPVLTDERPVIRSGVRLDAARFRVYGSPWPSSGGFVLNDSALLRKIYFIEHGVENALVPLTTREAVLRLLDVALVPWMDAAFFDPMIRTLENLICTVPHAVLQFRPDTSAVDFIRRDLADFRMEADAIKS